MTYLDNGFHFLLISVAVFAIIGTLLAVIAGKFMRVGECDDLFDDIDSTPLLPTVEEWREMTGGAR